MSRFLYRSALFAGLALLLLGGWSLLVVGVEIATYRREIQMPPGSHTLVCGDSQPAHAFDPACWPGLFNFSLDGTLLDQSRMKMEDVLAANPGQVQTLILDVSPWKFYVNNPYSALVDENAAAAQVLVNILHWRENRRPMRGFAKMFRDTILAKKTSKLHRFVYGKRPYKSNLCGGFVKTDKTHFSDGSGIVEYNIRRLADKLAVAPKAGEGSAVFDEWRQTIESARRAGVRQIVLVTTPFHPRLLAAIDAGRLVDFRSKTRSFAREVGCRYVDFLEFAVPDLGWRDGNHLNRHGAALFTDACRKVVES